jgi:hypothetical protein
MIQRLLLATLLPAALSACADDTRSYPSLLPRPIESRDTAEPVRTPPPVVADPALDASIARLTKTLADVASGWTGASRATAAKVAAARGKPAGSDAWLDAQTALAELDQYRAQTLAALGSVEDQAIARAADGQQPYPALDALRDTASAQLEAETKEIAERQALLPGS